jgi:hypothetical protein
MPDKCVFCEAVANSKEHVIPRWIQRHFNLRNQRLRLWNDTTIFYSNAIVPACERCNSEQFSKLEKRIQNEVATKQDYYLWALKIRWCLSLRDTTLLLDRRRPEVGSLISLDFATEGKEFVKCAFHNLGKPDFFYKPNPFGSVFLFPRNEKYGDEFDLIDVPHPHLALTIVLPSEKVLSVLFSDRGLVRRALSKECKNKGGLESFWENLSQKKPKLLTYLLLFWQYRLKIPYEGTIDQKGISSNRVPKKVKYRRQLRLQILIDIAKYCGFDESIAIKTYLTLPSHMRYDQIGL